MKPLEPSEFSRLPHARFLWNATRIVKEGVRLSITFNDPSGGLWHSGEWGSFEVAVQVNSGHGNGWSLVTFDGENSRAGCSEEDVSRIAAIAAAMELGPRMEVFDEVQGMTAPDWVHRFDTVIGEDLEDKRSYALRVWGRDGVRELPI